MVLFLNVGEVWAHWNNLSAKKLILVFWVANKNGEQRLNFFQQKYLPSYFSFLYVCPYITSKIYLVHLISTMNSVP